MQEGKDRYNMKIKIKRYIKNNASLYRLAKGIYRNSIKIYFTVTNSICNFMSKFHKKDPRFNSIKSLENKYSGRRCFIVATGPSLTLDDLDLLKDEITISMNSIIKLFDKTDFRPTVYVTQDNVFFKNSKELIKKIDLSSVYVGINDMGRRIWKPREAILINDLEGLPGVNVYNLNLSYNFAEWRYLGSPWKNKFSFDASKQIYDGGTVTYSAIQLAVYMGCKDVYLVGVDNGTKKGEKFHITDDEDEGKRLAEKIPASRFEKFQNNYIYAYNIMKKNGFNLYNATRGGALEGIPRISLDKVLEIKREK
jgi:hypothetical protein